MSAMGSPPSWCGSPPHTWGRRAQLDPLTPALAVHPHTRGEDACFEKPLAAERRFTPTHVGKTCPSPSPCTCRSVHPHTRGEDSLRRGSSKALAGSPPHTWGRHARRQSDPVRDRFTPTHVGKTTGSRSTSRAASVHPHTRGEDLFVCCRRARSRGSPPHTWGRRQQPPDRVGDGRFTPTHVGKTFAYPS